MTGLAERLAEVLRRCLPDGWTVCISRVPPAPDRVVVLFEQGAGAPQAAGSLEPRGIAVHVRGGPFGDGTGGQYAEVRAVTEVAYRRLHAQSGEQLGIPQIIGCVAETTPYPLGLDENGRPEFVVNFRCWVQRLTVEDPLWPI